MATKQISLRLLDMEDVERVAGELRTSKNKVVNASLHAHIHPDKPQNTAILKALGRKEEKAGKGVSFCWEEPPQDHVLRYGEKYYVTEDGGYRRWQGICGFPYSDYGYKIYRRAYRDDQPEPKGAAKP